MSSALPSVPAPPATTPLPAALERATPEEIDSSCRWPVVVLAAGGIKWLILGLMLSVVASIKLHAPGFLAAQGWLTFGRLQPAAWNCIVYGFAVPVGLAVAAWLTSRLGGTRLRGGRGMIAAAGAWNLGLLVGVLGLLAGDNTGIETLELPRYASPVLFVAYVGMAIWPLVTFHFRRERTVFVSQWFILAALFSFPWLYSGANWLAVYSPLRGVLQAAIQAWYAQNLYTLWLTFLALGAIFYLIPKVTGTPVPSRSLAVFGFWTLGLFGGLAGLQRQLGGPFPAWMTSVGVVFGCLTVIPVLALTLCLAQALEGQAARVKVQPVLWFILFAACGFVLTGYLGVLNSLPSVAKLTRLTLLTPALDQLTLQGVFGMAAFGALYYLLPRVTQCGWPSGRLVKAHFACLAVAISLGFLASGLGGLVHGAAMNDPSVPFLAVVKRYLPFAATGTLVNLLLLAGNLLFGMNLLRLLAGCGRERYLPAVKVWFQRQPPPAEVEA